ncbi:MAG: metallopeptidase family protein [bacterium]|nr:metallopeptidase family protein [bacterium]
MIVPREEFEQMVIDGLAKVPGQFHDKIRNVVFIVEDETSPETRKENHLLAGQDLLGLYKGVPLTQRGDNYGVGMVLPDVITIFQGPTERSAGGDFEKVRDMVRDTVFHEVAHYLGMSEGEVAKWEARQV